MPDLVFDHFNSLRSRDSVILEDKLISCQPDEVNTCCEYSKGDVLVGFGCGEN